MSSNPYQTRDENQLKLIIREEELSVAPESQANIRISVMNESPRADDVDILVKGIPADWTIMDTRVVHLAAGEAKEVVLTVQPPSVPQSRVGQFPLDISVVSRSDPTRSATARIMLTVAAYESRGRIGVMLASVHFSVIPGSTVHIPILLQNRGLAEDSFRLSIAGLPANWISTNSAVTRLEPSASREITVTVHVPRSPQATAGRTPFVIQFTSQVFPDQRTDVDCILTISAFSQFSATLEPATLEAGQFGQVIISNEGNTTDAYSLSFQSPGNGLIFEKAVQVARPGAQLGTQQVQIAYAEIPQEDRFQVAAGERGAYPFRTRLRSRPIIGGAQAYPFMVRVVSSEKRVYDLQGQLNERGWIPIWLLGLLLAGSLLLCLLLLIPLRNLPTSARATQTAAFNQTQAALSGQTDSDGDGLTDMEEPTLGTDPLKADTDGDQLSDGEEVKTYRTNPLLADTDSDGLPDGVEIGIGTDPLQPDTDKDGLPDGQENQTCPGPLMPDSDGDGLLDGADRDPCNPNNPSLTTTAQAGAPTQPQPTAVQPTQVSPTQVPPTQVPPTQPPPTVVVPPPTLLPTATFIEPTNPPPATITPAPPSLQGNLLFSTNRDGNSEIYVLNLGNQALTRLTSNTAQDVQPALAPDSVQVAYVTNQDGNNEIYLGGIDRRIPLNLTRNAADDQNPTWSPDGNWIAFTTNRDGNQEIYVMRSDGSQLRNLTNNPANDSEPAWFSVGGLFGSDDWIAFTSTRDGNQEIYKVRPDGTGLANLTQNPANDRSPAGFAGGQWLAFVTERDGNPEIYTMNQNGGALTNITNNSAQDLDPAINSNGSWIAFSTDREGNLEIYIVKPQGGAAFNLTHNPSQERQPDW